MNFLMMVNVRYATDSVAILFISNADMQRRSSGILGLATNQPTQSVDNDRHSCGWAKIAHGLGQPF